jgi:D-arabinose 1-dehydrogenase-like Zn-dependent alcohol dehydrogenase
MEMKAAIFENPGLENLRVMDNVKEPQLTGHHDVLIRVKVAGVNPIDNFEVSGALPKLIPLSNHIPEAELSGVVEKVGSHVNNLSKGDRVIIHNKVFDGACDMCLNGLDMICRNGGLISVITNGGFAKYISC